MSPGNYTEDSLVEQPAIQLFAELGWETLSASDEVMGTNGTLGRETKFVVLLVLHDMLDIYPGKKARFVKNYMQGAASIADAVARYVREVKEGSFPAQEHGF